MGERGPGHYSGQRTIPPDGDIIIQIFWHFQKRILYIQDINIYNEECQNLSFIAVLCCAILYPDMNKVIACIHCYIFCDII